MNFCDLTCQKLAKEIYVHRKTSLYEEKWGAISYLDENRSISLKQQNKQAFLFNEMKKKLL